MQPFLSFTQHVRCVLSCVCVCLCVRARVKWKICTRCDCSRNWCPPCCLYEQLNSFKYKFPSNVFSISLLLLLLLFYFYFYFCCRVPYERVCFLSLPSLSLSLSLSLKTKRKFSKRQRKNVRSVPREVFQYNSITHQVPFSLSKARRSGVFVALETIHDPR